jgi:hypothetical protein
MWSCSSAGLEHRAYKLIFILVSREGRGFDPRLDHIIILINVIYSE